MPHHTPLIATVVGGLVLAFILGAIANRLRISPLVGYLMAGVVVGPFTPGFVADQALAPELAELGVILLMFGVGMHFSLKDLLSVKTIAIPGAIAQIGVATLLGIGLALAMGWGLGAGFVFGLALSVASTVVLLRALQERHMIESERGRIAVGWLIVEDLAMVLALVLLPPLATLMKDGAETGGGGLGSSDLAMVLLITLAKVAAFVALMLIVGRRVIPWLLHYIAHTGSRELFRLAVLAIALGVAYGAAMLFGVSFALGAFFAGMILAESELSHRAAEESLPLRDAFAVLFFVSVGMLFDPGILLRDPLPVLATFLIIVVGKSVAALALVLAFRHKLSTALTIAASLAQIGEFSFILAALGVDLGLLPAQGRDLIVTGAILSILANPLFFALLDRLKDWLEKREGQDSLAEDRAKVAEEELLPTALQQHAVLIGFGRVGSLVAEALRREGRPLLVIEERQKLAEQARAAGYETMLGNAASAEMILASNIVGARWLFVAIPNAFEAGQIVQQARKANPALKIIARAHADGEVEHLSQLGADLIVMGEREIARGMMERAFPMPGSNPEPAEPGPAAA
ncbi:YbaL family putative K(+) efflux transporter [Ferrovibrio sp.]|uniref:YbaL family putative K(+) efflux transporter n=1 Tax=Ferrovibrio sp. TaxID=1917215 RepID=UPI001B6104C4|nr:YbaL family putative K(+) efflux transporter [Ferrovibrio sp.]MBP7065692.1 Kef family K(+) transporter [Ferrovibrio sp.]